MYQSVALEVDGKLLRGVVRTPQGDGKFPTLIFMHGFTVDKVGPARLYEMFAKQCQEEGIAVIRFDFYGCGESDGDFSEMTIGTEMKEMTAIYKWAKAQSYVDSDKIFLGGHSMGGLLATLLAPELNPCGVMAWSPALLMYYEAARRARTMKGETRNGYDINGLELSKLKSQEDQGEIVKRAMEHPVGSELLRELAKGKKTAVLIVSDHTRPVPSRYIVPQMLAELREGNPEIDITILVATGCHRGTKKEELISKLGEDIVFHEKIEVHDCDNSPVTDLGVLPSGAHLIINSLAANADLVVSEGFIEPHFFAGYSGGRKSILPGICGRKTVLGNHCSAFIKDPLARMGVLEGNPINRDMEAAARMAKLAYIVNVVIDEEKKVVAAFAGDCVEAHHAGCSYLESFCSVTPDRKGDIVITSNGGAPLDQNVYQAVKGLTTAEAAASEHGTLIICAECADGIGGDQFYRALSQSESAEALLDQIEKVPMEDTVPDQWQYQILARILKQHRVLFVTNPGLQEKIAEMKMEFADSVQEAYEKARAEKGDSASLMVIPNGVSIVIKEK